MLDIEYQKDHDSNQKILYTSLQGKALLSTPQLNKGTAFTVEERIAFKLQGKLPVAIETLEQQVIRAYSQFQAYQNNLNKNIYLNDLHDTNQVLFYRLVSEHLSEMLPIIYTPIVGTAVKKFSHDFRRSRGIYLSYPERGNMEVSLRNRSNPDIDLIVVTDGETVLGIGDQGIGGMDIPIAKLMVYSLCGGIDPIHTLPIHLDVGTNNAELLNDPLYLGWRHPRITGTEYDEFIASFVTTVKTLFPHVFLHWEDFGRENARRNLERFQEHICTFNDDMQGTGVVALSAILAAVAACHSTITKQRIVIFGAGTAGTGIADQICDAMVHEGLSFAQAKQHFWLLDRPGLLFRDMPGLTPYQQAYARERSEIDLWHIHNQDYIHLEEVIAHVKPTILIGCSAVPGAFTELAIRTMAKYTPRPIILPLSNPNPYCEAQPKDLYQWTEGNVLMATGSPFDPINHQGRNHRIAQCNNALVFPGLGLGLIVSKAKRLSNECLWRACQTLSHFAPVRSDLSAPLLPELPEAREIARQIAIAVADQVITEGQAGVPINSDIANMVDHYRWTPAYFPYCYRSNPGKE